MAEPLLTLSASPDITQGTLRAHGFPNEKQSLAEGAHPFAQLLRGHRMGAGEDLEETAMALLPSLGGKPAGQPLAVDGKDLPDAARLLSLAGLSLEDGAALPSSLALLLADTSLEAAPATEVVPLADPVAALAMAASAQSAPPVVLTEEADGADSSSGPRLPGAAAAFAAAHGQRQAGVAALPGQAPEPEALSLPEPVRGVAAAVQQALQQRAMETAGRALGERIRIAATQGAEVTPRADGQSVPVSQAGSQPQAPTLPTTALAVPLRQAGWDQALGEQVQWLVGNKLQGAQIRLNPAHLGPLEVRIQVQNDQAHISFTAQHGAVREALEAALPRLREMLAESGLQLNNVTVSDQSLAEQRRQGGQLPFAQAAAGQVDGAVEEEPLQTLVTPLREGAGTIDYFA